MNRTLTAAELRAKLGGRRRAAFRARASREAGVLAPFFERDGELRLLLTKRSDKLKNHQGQISFPGGRRDEADEGLLATALRETEEEIGIPPGGVEVLGELDAVFTAVSNYTVYPVAGIIAQPANLRVNQHEIDEVLELRVADLLNPSNFRAEDWSSIHHRGYVYFFEVDRHIVWGLTAHILKTLFDEVVPGWNPKPEAQPRSQD
ncbi:MAG: putative Nudix hydrolase NudL [Myxococcota bacterium]|nr:putative Nudix hydrolase NudL [Myxococcota bacterium]